MNQLPSYSMEKGEYSDSKEPIIVWENEANPKLRLVVVYSVTQLPPRAAIERCDGLDAVGDEIWLEVKDKEAWWNIKDVVLKALAIASADDYSIMEN